MCFRIPHIYLAFFFLTFSSANPAFAKTPKDGLVHKKFAAAFVDTPEDVDSAIILPRTPPNGFAHANSRGFKLEWEALYSSFDVYMGTDSAALSMVAAGTGRLCRPTGTLESGRTYYWRIIGHRDGGGRDTSQLWSFTTSPFQLACRKFTPALDPDVFDTESDSRLLDTLQKIDLWKVGLMVMDFWEVALGQYPNASHNIVSLINLSRNLGIPIVHLLHEGWQTPAVVPDSGEFVKADVRDKEALQKACRSRSAVIHLAASVGNLKSLQDPHMDAEVNVLGTRNVIEAVVSCSVETIVYASSAAIYGSPEYLPIDERHPCEPDSPYGVSKLAGEKDVLCQSRVHDFRSVCLRPFNVYGVNQRYNAYGNVIPIFFHRMVKREELIVFGDGAQTRDFVNVRDVAAAFVESVLKKESDGVFDVGSGVSSTIAELVAKIRRLVSWEVSVRHVPPRKGEVIHSGASIRRLVQTLKKTPMIALEEGLSEYWNWFMEEQSLIQKK